MSKLVTLLFFLLLTEICFCFNVNHADYCKVLCYDKSVSSACRCTRKKNKEEITSDLIQFRQSVVDTHNYLRNKLASGEEEHKFYPSASNMMAVNYDLELEHLARCFVLGSFNGDHDKCRMTKYCQKGKSEPGQNLYGIGVKVTDVERTPSIVKLWYGELNFIPTRNRDSYMKRLVGGPWLHFTQVVWASTVRVGCARAWDSTLEGDVASWRFVMACNYAGPPDDCAANVRKREVYRTGEPCSRCGSGIQCNAELGGPYKALCGGVDPVPRSGLEPLRVG